MRFINKITSFFNPEQFQGWGKRKNYFEGWYFKILNKEETIAFAFIPGISFDINGIGHSFIQVLDGKAKTSKYYRFEADQFIPSAKSFHLSIEKNSFSEKNLQLNLPQIKGSLFFDRNVPWPKPIYSPGIMGPYAFVPFMECYHGIVSMDHRISGSLEINKENIDFTGGRGYIEKDWGKSFPEAYIWMQSNHFSQENISIKLSVAKIPWIGKSFIGFIAGVWVRDQLIQFTTYNKTKLKKVQISDNVVSIEMENKLYHLKIKAINNDAVSLASPVQGAMEGKIEESMTAIIEVSLFSKKEKKVILNDSGRNAAVEVAGSVVQLLL
jgi:tocopherol cyclase